MRYMLIISVIATLIWPLTAQAHKFSTAYMDVTQQHGQPLLLWKVALHDLAQAGLIQTQDSHQVSWQQVLDSEKQLQDYINQRLSFSSAAGPCNISTTAADWLAQRVQQDLFLLLPLRVSCAGTGYWQLGYQALFDSQHSHKLLLSWQLPGAKANAVLTTKSPLYPQAQSK